MDIEVARRLVEWVDEGNYLDLEAYLEAKRVLRERKESGKGDRS